MYLKSCQMIKEMTHILEISIYVMGLSSIVRKNSTKCKCSILGEVVKCTLGVVKCTLGNWKSF